MISVIFLDFLLAFMQTHALFVVPLTWLQKNDSVNTTKAE